MGDWKVLAVLFLLWLIVVGALFGWSVYTLSNVLYRFYSGEKLGFWDFFWGLIGLFIFLRFTFSGLVNVKAKHEEEW